MALFWEQTTVFPVRNCCHVQRKDTGLPTVLTPFISESDIQQFTVQQGRTSETEQPGFNSFLPSYMQGSIVWVETPGFNALT